MPCGKKGSTTKKTTSTKKPAPKSGKKK